MSDVTMSRSDLIAIVASNLISGGLAPMHINHAVEAAAQIVDAAKREKEIVDSLRQQRGQ